MNWSLSKLGTFTKCRRRFLYSYLRQLKGTEQPRGAKDRGIDMHAELERFFKDGTVLPHQFASREPWFKKLRSLEHYSESKHAMLEGWLPCDWDNPSAWWKGVLDLKVLARPRAWVFDWKTGKVYPDHVDQKELYTIATFVEHPDIDEVEAWHIYLDLKGKDTKEVYHREQLPALIAKWNGKLVPYMQAVNHYNEHLKDDNDLAATFFVTNPSWGCDYCPYSKNPCPH